MLLVGLTGALGSGKSTVGQALARRGATVVDTDDVARAVLAPGSSGEAQVVARFGDEVQGAGGSLDRRELARVAFSHPERRRALEAITHPLIRQKVTSLVAAARGPVVVVEIPLLDAARREQYALDAVVLVDAPPELCLHRALGRGLCEQDARARMAAQPSADERRALADWTVVNDGDLTALGAEVERLWLWLLARAQAKVTGGGPPAS